MAVFSGLLGPSEFAGDFGRRFAGDFGRRFAGDLGRRFAGDFGRNPPHKSRSRGIQAKPSLACIYYRPY